VAGVEITGKEIPNEQTSHPTALLLTQHFSEEAAANRAHKNQYAVRKKCVCGKNLFVSIGCQNF
jgi:hypothetical protein